MGNNQDDNNKNNSTIASPFLYLKKLFVSLYTLLTRDKGTALGASLLTVLTLVGFWLSPLKTKIFHLIWTERSEIDLRVSSNKVLIGSELEINPLIYSLGEVSVGEGVLTIDFDQDNFKLIDGRRAINTPEVLSGLAFGDEMNLKVRVLKEGKLPIYAQLKTRYGTYFDTLVLAAHSSFGRPTNKNWTGEWFCKIGDESFQMNIRQLDKKGSRYQLRGDYLNYNTKEHGIIYWGSRDGDTFEADFRDTLKQEKWLINAYFKNIVSTGGERYIKIEGTARLSSITEEGLEEQNIVKKFIADARIDE